MTLYEFGRPRLYAAGAAVVALHWMFALAARADSGATDEADRLFHQGKELMGREDYARACPLLAESFRLDPATGALLALAICHEGEGKLASAFREYNEVATRSQREQRKDREQAARDQASALAPRVSTLTITVASEVEELELQLDGATLDPALLGKPLPVDGGDHVIKITGRNMKPSTTLVAIAQSKDSKSVVVAALKSDVPAAATAPAASKPMRAVRRRAPGREPRRVQVESERPDEAQGLSGWQWTGIVMMGVGVVGVAGGTLLAVEAVSKNEDSMLGCAGDLCNAQGRRDRLDARKAGDLATVALSAGGGLMAIGLVTYVLGASSSTEEQQTDGLAAAAWTTGKAAGAVVRGSF